jgi:hypothetical protein
MQIAFEVTRALSALAFLFFGTLCLRSDRLIAEFERYGLASMRQVVGVLEIAGAVGLVVGEFHRPLFVLSSGGLALLMIAGVATRIRIRDSLLQTSPALALLAMNAFLCAVSLRAS